MKRFVLALLFVFATVQWVRAEVVGSEGWIDNFSTQTTTLSSSSKRLQRNCSMPQVWDVPLSITTTANTLICNKGSSSVTVSAVIGVTCPSQNQYPMFPYVGLSHPNYQFNVSAGACVPLTIVRLDAAVSPNGWPPLNGPIDLVKSSSGCYPAPAMVVQLVSGSGPVTVQDDLTQIGTPLE